MQTVNAVIQCLNNIHIMCNRAAFITIITSNAKYILTITLLRQLTRSLYICNNGCYFFAFVIDE